MSTKDSAPPACRPTAHDVAAALAPSRPVPFWLDTPDRPAPRPALSGDARCDLLVVGGGFSGLWTALLAKERDPDRDVLLVEGDRIAEAASGRNGGFCAATLTHGSDNGRSRFGDAEQERLDALGHANLDEIAEAVARYGIDCDFERTGELDVATQPHQVPALRDGAGEFLDADAVRAQLDSPTYLAGSWDRDGVAMLDPARLAWGLAAAAERLGVRIAEGTRVTRLRSGADGVRLSTLTGSTTGSATGSTAAPATGTITADRVALATNAFRPLLARLRWHTVPVYDYVLVTEPLTDEQLVSIGWGNRQGVGDSGNQFHYYRLTRDHRVLWGGYDAIYHYGRRTGARYDERPATHRLLAQHFFETFPQLAGVRFSHRWGGVIDTSTRFFAFYGTAHRGRVAYGIGHTGLGVGPTRFAAQVVLDLLAGEETERTATALVRRRPLPFPPEPLAWIGVQLTRASLARADRRGGHRDLWLRALDRCGLGFDS